MGGLSLELGPEPDRTPPLTVEEQRERERESERQALREEYRTRFAHVGGMDLTDAQIDAALGYGRAPQ